MMVVALPAEALGASPPPLSDAFSSATGVGAPIEPGTIDDGRERFIPILGCEVYGPRLNGIILPAGGDRQIVRADGRAECSRAISSRRRTAL